MAASRNPVSSSPAKPGHPVAPMAAIGDHHRDFTGRDHDGPCASDGDNRGTFRDGAFIRIARRRTRRALLGRGQARRAARFPRLLSQRQEVGARGVFAPGRRHAMHDHDRLGHQRGRSLYAARRPAGAGRRHARGTGAGPLPRHHGIGQPFRDVARLRQPQAGRRLARSGRADAAVVARRKSHHRWRGGEIQERFARLEAHRDPAALHRQPRAADSATRRHGRRRRAGRQLRNPARDRLRQGTHPARTGSIQAQLAAISGCAPGSISPCSSARTIRCRRASSAG